MQEKTNIKKSPKVRKITIRVDGTKDDARLRDHNEEYEPKFPHYQPTTVKPPSGSQTLPTPRKYYNNHNTRLHMRLNGESTMLPFGGGQELEHIQAELQV